MFQNSEKAQRLRERNRKLVEKFFSLKHNSPEKNAMYDEHCIWEQPYFRPGEKGPIFHEDGEEPTFEIPEGFEFPEFTPEWHWDGETKIWGTDDPNYLFAENRGHGMQLTGENVLKPYANHYFHTFLFNEDGKITYYREIANPLNLMKTMGCEFESLPKPEDTIHELIALYNKNHIHKL